MRDPFIRRCQVLRVIDGDTLRVRIDLGWNVYAEHNIRLLRVNAPELGGATAVAGQAAKDYVESWVGIYTDPALEWPYVVRSEKSDSFGRYLCEFETADGEANLSDALLETGHAVPFVRRSVG